MPETLLSYGEDAKKSQLTSELFYKDEAGNMDKTVTAAANGYQPNSGLLQRRAFVAGSREFDMIGRIHGDIFFQEGYMLNEVGMKIKLVRSKDSFRLMGAADAKLIVTHASLFVRKVKLSPSVFLAHEGAGEQHCQISYKTSGMQNDRHSAELSRRQPRETVVRTASDTHSRGIGRQQSL